MPASSRVPAPDLVNAGDDEKITLDTVTLSFAPILNAPGVTLPPTMKELEPLPGVETP